MGVLKTARKIIHEGISSSSSSHGEKRAWKLVCQPKTIIGSLPGDLLIDVLARVASSSSNDLFNAKICCKDFLEAAEDEYIYQRISIDEFPMIRWFPPNDRADSFIAICLEKGNPEALFRQGMREYFSLVNIESGLEYLKRASEKGHIEATYVYSLILLSQGDQSGQLTYEFGLEVLKSEVLD